MKNVKEIGNRLVNRNAESEISILFYQVKRPSSWMQHVGKAVRIWIFFSMFIDGLQATFFAINIRSSSIDLKVNSGACSVFSAQLHSHSRTNDDIMADK